MDFDTTDSMNPDLDQLEQDDDHDTPTVLVRPVGTLRTHRLPARIAHARQLPIVSTRVEQIAVEDLRRGWMWFSVTGQPVYIGHDKRSVDSGIAGILPVGSVIRLDTSEPIYAKAIGDPAPVMVGPDVTEGFAVVGAELSLTVPAGEHWELESIFFDLVTDATAGDRTVQLIIDDGANMLVKVVSAVTQPISSTYQYSYTAQAGYEPAAARLNVVMQGIPRMTLAEGYRIRTSTNNFAAGDNFGALYVAYKRADLASTATLSYWSGQWAD